MLAAVNALLLKRMKLAGIRAPGNPATVPAVA